MGFDYKNLLTTYSVNAIHTHIVYYILMCATRKHIWLDYLFIGLNAFVSNATWLYSTSCLLDVLILMEFLHQKHHMEYNRDNWEQQDGKVSLLPNKDYYY